MALENAFQVDLEIYITLNGLGHSSLQRA